MHAIIALIYIAVSAATFMAFGCDKANAIDGKRRIPEKTLLRMIMFGGAAGAYAGMKVFRHKTLKPKFRIVTAACLAVQVLLLCCL